jgi:hypothetical protein
MTVTAQLVKERRKQPTGKKKCCNYTRQSDATNIEEQKT